MRQQLRVLLALLIFAVLGAGISACDPKHKEEITPTSSSLSVSELREAFLSQKNCANTLIVGAKGSQNNSAAMRCRVYDTAALIEIGYSTWKMTEALNYHLARISGYGLEERAVLEALSSQNALGGIFFENGEGSDKQSLIQSHFDFLLALKKGQASLASRSSFEYLSQQELAPTDAQAETAVCSLAYAEVEMIQKLQKIFEIRALAQLLRSGKVNSELDLENFKLGEFNLQEMDRILANFQMLTKPYVLIRKMGLAVSALFARSTQVSVFGKPAQTKIKLNCLLVNVFEDAAFDQSLREGVIKGLNVRISDEMSTASEAVSVQVVPTPAEGSQSGVTADANQDLFTHILSFPSDAVRDLNSYSAQEIRDALIDASQKK